jgi:hypothetical protein
LYFILFGFESAEVGVGKSLTHVCRSIPPVSWSQAPVLQFALGAGIIAFTAPTRDNAFLL